MSEAQYAAGEHMFAAVHPFVPGLLAQRQEEKGH